MSEEKSDKSIPCHPLLDAAGTFKLGSSKLKNEISIDYYLKGLQCWFPTATVRPYEGQLQGVEWSLTWSLKEGWLFEKKSVSV